MKKVTAKIVALVLLGFLSGCLSTKPPEGIEPVQNFSLESYLGTWYEIARLDHPFEEGLSNVTATYSMRDDGGVEVLNKGYNTEDQEWEDAKGKAFFVQAPGIGHLKVSFFGPFYGSYVIFFLDDYQHAFVSGPNRDYLWYLSRSPEVSDTQWNHFIEVSKQLGFDVSEIIRVSHDDVES